MQSKKLNIPKELIKIKKGRDVLISIRITKADKKFIDKYKISPTALFNVALEQVKKDTHITVDTVILDKHRRVV